MTFEQIEALSTEDFRNFANAKPERYREWQIEHTRRQRESARQRSAKGMADFIAHRKESAAISTSNGGVSPWMLGRLHF